MPQRQCTATTKAGAPCRAPALPGEDLCFSHSPTKAAERDARNRRGGHNKGNAVRATKTWTAAGLEMKTEDMPAMLRGMAEAVASGELEPSKASAIAQLVKAARAIEEQIDAARRQAELDGYPFPWALKAAIGHPTPRGKHHE